ncbi:MAG: folate family ECF transporter S component [Oscillospiraceae bacterium]|nr:folate family ECF transporter S component [Oscillospiraceae bacterium]
MPESKSNSLKNIFSVRNLCFMAMLIALQIVLARYVGWQVSPGLRISFETIPIMLAGMWMGPVAGLIVGFLSDFLGTVLSGYGAYFVPLAITPVFIGVVSPLVFKYLFKNKITVINCVITLFLVQLIASLLLGTYALTWYYKLVLNIPDKAFTALFATRLVPKLVTSAVCTAVVTALHMAAYERAIKPILNGRRR